MAAENFYFAISQPTSADPEAAPYPGDPIGSGVTVGTSSDSSAQMELRVLTPNANTNSGGGALTANEVCKGLERILRFIRQRGFIAGSGGPSGSWILP